MNLANVDPSVLWVICGIAAIAQVIWLASRGKRLAMERSVKLGATAIEYGLIAALVSVAGIVALEAMGTSLSTMFKTVDESPPAVKQSFSSRICEEVEGTRSVDEALVEACKKFRAKKQR